MTIYMSIANVSRIKAASANLRIRLGGVVMVCVQLNDEESAQKYIMKGLPNLSTEMRDARKAWVERNVETATEQLLHLQSSNAIYEKISKAFSRDIIVSVDDSSSSWQ